MKIAIASDHRGVKYKKEIINYLEEKNYMVIDCSKENTPTDDYPDFAFKVCKKVVEKESDIGILVCRTGIGMSIAANKVKGVRCAKINSIEDAILSRNDNGANIMTFNYTDSMADIKKYIDAFINAEVINDERHQRRVNKIMAYEENHYHG
ncbi:MAG: RpiB/LacA/LacB family sugar-phosphate isomerase [Bacilli bacterium]|nr:RpiB/LacA/LacB family sugar-phosphate isomerase [Bacilli bacterium]